MLQLLVIYKKINYCSSFERGSNSPEPLEDEIINPSDQVVNANSPEISNLDNMFQYKPFIMSGLGLEPIQELFLIESIH